ncbi:XRE family transcriptional regulator [Stenotrophomonas sp. GD03777]|uniref:LexA family transcriptional regulator n=1 Tax=unclassified Stenotrophomonas TaxID=196198 RepID=UPI00244D6379|nr:MULTISPECIES: XRE family transcriptional regulator [unclassified Stenotrophomonas]MDH1660751.1 XRE family transcriptional regulator [Stenotrophomonas sp. GD03777]
MENSRKSKPTPADVAAAAKLKLEWQARARSLGLTQDQVADELGITQGAVSQYLNGKIPMNYRTLLVFCRLLGISDTDVRRDLPEQQLLGPPTDSGDWADIKGYAQAMGLGGGPEAQEYAETHRLKFRAESLARKRLRPDALAVMYGRGDSMEPRIHSGDAVLFDTTDTRPRDGHLYVIMVDGGGAAKEYQVKRCEVIDDLVFFKADNPRGDHNWRKPKRMDSPRHPIQVIGRVRWIGSWEE